MEEKDVFTTNNAPLAMALIAAGVPLYGQKVIHCYYDEFLKRHGATSFEDARDRVIPDLKQRGIWGRITFCFERSEGLDALLAAWDDQAKKTKEGKVVSLPAMVAEECVRVCAYIQAAKGLIMEGLKNGAPMVSIARGSGWVAVSADASPELLKKLNIQ